MHTSFEMFSLEFFALQDSSSAAASQFPEKLQHRYNRDDDARQRRPHGAIGATLDFHGIEHRHNQAREVASFRGNRQLGSPPV